MINSQFGFDCSDPEGSRPLPVQSTARLLSYNSEGCERASISVSLSLRRRRRRNDNILRSPNREKRNNFRLKSVAAAAAQSENRRRSHRTTVASVTWRHFRQFGPTFRPLFPLHLCENSPAYIAFLLSLSHTPAFQSGVRCSPLPPSPIIPIPGHTISASSAPMSEQGQMSV